MSNLLDLVQQHLGSEQVDQIASRLGATREQTESAIGMALPTLLGAVARKADDESSAEQLHQTLQKEDGGLLERLGSLFGGSGATADQPTGAQAFGGTGELLGSLLGGRQEKVEQGIGKASGLSGGQIASLLAMLAPVLMGALAKKSGGMDLGGLTSMLRSEKKSMENQATGGLLAGLLDQDGDGDFDFADIMQLGMSRLFGRK